MSHRHPNYLAWLAVLALAGCAPRSPFSATELMRLRALANQADADRLMLSVSELSAAHLTDTPLDCSRWDRKRLEETHQIRFCHQTRDKAGALMESRLRELGLSVQRQSRSGELFETSNVIAELPGVTRPEEVVLVGAHFDAFYGGADDNSTGVAAVLEMARILSQQRHERTLLFVGFDLEEWGAIGSNRFLEQFPPEQRIVATLVLDSLGYYDTRPGSQTSIPGLPAPDRGDFLTLIANAPSAEQAAEIYALNEALSLSKVISLVAPGDGNFPLAEPLLRSDHAPFWSNGTPALFATDTAPFRNPNYHQSTDTPETLNPEFFQRTVQTCLVALSYLAGGMP